MQHFQESEGVESEYVDDDAQDEGVDELESDEDMEVRPVPLIPTRFNLLINLSRRGWRI